MRSGVRLGVDVGKARIGIARSDLHGMLATPVETVARAKSGQGDLARIEEIVLEEGAFEVVVGLPLNLSGQHTPSTDDAVSFAGRLATRLALHDIAVRLVDERLSTVVAHGQLRATGKKTKQTRHVVDQVAAVVILQQALDSERSQGEAPGSVVAHIAAEADGAPGTGEAGDAAETGRAAGTGPGARAGGPAEFDTGEKGIDA